MSDCCFTPPPVSGLAQIAVVAPTPTLRRVVVRALGATLGEKPSEQKLVSGCFPHARIGNVSVLGPAVGSSGAALCLAPCLESGLSSVLFFGVGGAFGDLANAAAIGESVAVTGSTSSCSVFTRYAPNTTLLETTPSIAAAHEAVAYSTDTPFLESTETLMQQSQCGATIVEMECAPVHALTHYYNTPFCALIVVSDVLVDGAWRRGFGSKELTDGLQIAAERIAAHLA